VKLPIFILAALSLTALAFIKSPNIINSQDSLPGNGLSQHPFLYAGEWDTRENHLQTIHVVRNGKVVWSYGIPIKDVAKNEVQELGDAFMLANGNILFSRKVGASEITPDKKIIWNYEAPPKAEIHTTQPIGKDRVMIMQNGNPAKIMIINKVTGKVEKELIIPTERPDSPHGQFRHVRMTTAGTFLVPHMSGKVIEYDQAGKEIWSYTTPSPWAAVRLKNGNTLISGDGSGYAREVNSKGETVWEFTQKDVPDIKIFNIQEVGRLSNGNTIICNWCAGGLKNTNDWPGSVQILEVTPDKKVVWALSSWKDPADLGPASSIQLLDEPGIAENGDLQR
jgi:hypothetical protein